MTHFRSLFRACILVAVLTEVVQPICVLESDFGLKINCAFKKSGLFRVRNLGGIKAHASLGFSLGDELGFEQSLTNQDPSRRRSVSARNGAPNVLVDTSNKPYVKQEKRGKQNRIMMRPMAPVNRPNQAAMDKLTSLHRRVATTMQPIIVAGPTLDTPTYSRPKSAITMAKPMRMGVPPFKPLPPKDETLKVLPISSTKQTYSPLQLPPNAPGIIYPNMVPHQVHDLANMYPAYNTKKVDDYNTISGYSEDTALKINKDDIDAKIAEIAKVGNISMEAVEAAIALRQQQLLSKYASITAPTTTSTTPTEEPAIFQMEPEPEIVVAPVQQKPKRNPTTSKVMNAPKEYYPVGYEKNFDDHFQSKVDLPDTTFHCGDQKYFPGLYGDESLGCMVFHVCALTDDGLVMKSFLCPESTLFDQTILKCNWWFYVDCKNTVKLYDTNIPVSKSYQLMKALTFFSSYKKEMAEENPENSEDLGDGVKKAISILENKDNQPSSSNTEPIVVPALPIIDERHSNSRDYSNTMSTLSPVYRGSRNYNQTAETRRTAEAKSQKPRGFTASTESTPVSAENSSESTSSETVGKRQRQRFMFRNNHATTKYTSTTSTPQPRTTESIENLTLPGKPIEELPLEVKGIEKQENLTDQVATFDEVDTTISKEIESLPPVKRFYRSSAEVIPEEINAINNEKIQIVRPTSTAQLVGEYNTQTAAIAKLDEAVLGAPVTRFKKDVIAIIRPDPNEVPWRPIISDQS